MGSDVNQRTAALLFLIQEHAPGGNGSPAERMSLCIVNLSQLAVLTGTLQIDRIRTVTVLVANGQNLPGALRSLHHGFGFRIGLRHGLLAHDVLARFHSRNADGRMGAVGGQHIYRLHILLQQFRIIGIYF